MHSKCVCVAGLRASGSMLSELFAAVGRHSDLPSPVPWHQQPREPFSCRGFELGWGSQVPLTFKTGASGADQHGCGVPQLIASAQLTLTAPLVIQAVAASRSSGTGNGNLCSS